MWKLVHRKTVWRPTLLGKILLLIIGLAGCRMSAPFLYRFLSPSTAPAGDFLVVEGWIPDTFLIQMKSLAAEQNYQKIYCTGGPLEVGHFLSEYDTWAKVGAERLIRSGFPRSKVVEAPARSIQKDRTYASAIGLRNLLLKNKILDGVHIDLITFGPHARRSRVLYQKALGTNARVGVLSVEPDSYNGTNWWKSSEGFRGVVYELLAYGYTRLWLLTQPGDFK